MNNKVGKISITKYCNTSGSDASGSMFPTMTTVNVEGSLKQSLKCSHACMG